MASIQQGSAVCRGSYLYSCIIIISHFFNSMSRSLAKFWRFFSTERLRLKLKISVGHPPGHRT